MASKRDTAASKERIMKKTVLTFGLIAGAILSVMMMLTLPFMDRIGFDRGEIIGYTTMVLAFLLIYFGVRSYRDNQAGGTVGFGRALAVGLLISLVASLCYVATWEVIYYKIAPDFGTKYQAHIVEKARRNGESEQAIARRKADMERFVELYRNPAINVAMTLLEPMPVALIMSLVSAGLLSRRPDARSGRSGAASRTQLSM
jgi:hypothetical protein